MSAQEAPTAIVIPSSTDAKSSDRRYTRAPSVPADSRSPTRASRHQDRDPAAYLQGPACTGDKKDWALAFLAAFAETSMVTEACKAAGIARRTAYDRRQRDEAFALAWADVEERSTEDLEHVAVRRAKEGSDTLLIFLCSSRVDPRSTATT